MNRVFACIILIFIISSLNLQSQWKKANCGFYWGSIQAFAINNNTIYAGACYAGVFVSSDNGNTWTSKVNGLTNDSITSIVASGNMIYTGTFGSGIFLSTNNGDLWSNTNNGLTEKRIKSLAIIGNNIFAGTFNGIYRSSNKADSWEFTGLKDRIIQCIVEYENDIFIGTDQGIFLSKDNGKNWIPKKSGLNITDVFSIAISGKTIIAGTYRGIYISSNYGDTWKEKGVTNEIVYSMIIIDNKLFAVSNGTIFISTNMGNFWTENYKPINYSSFCSLATDGKNIFAGTGNGRIFLSTDEGANWVTKNNESSSLEIRSFGFKNDYIFAGANGFYVSADTGNFWTQKNLKFQYNWNTVSCITTIGEKIYINTDAYGLMVSTDNGDNWNTKTIDLPKLIYGGRFFFNGNDIFTTTVNGIYMSNDGGESWIPKNNGIENISINTIAIEGKNIYAGAPQKGLYRSTDYGENWEFVWGITNYIGDISVFNNKLYVGTDKGIYISYDHGLNWDKMITGLPLDYSSVISISEYQDYLLVATSDRGVFIASDNGEKWNSKNNGLSDTNVACILIFKENIFAGTKSGIFKAKLNDVLTGVNENTVSNIELFIYPNPVNNTLNVRLDKVFSINTQLTLYDIFGKKLLENQIPAGINDFKIKMDGFIKGIYFLSIQNKYLNETRKFIIN